MAPHHQRVVCYHAGMSEDFLSQDNLYSTRRTRIARVVVYGVVALLVLATVAVWWYARPGSEAPPEDVGGEEAVDERVARLVENPPYDPDEEYFAGEDGLSLSGAELNEFARQDLEALLAFEFTYVPDILEQVALLPPSEDSDARDLSTYESVQSADEPPSVPLMPDGQPVYEVIDRSPHMESVYDVRTEVMYLTIVFHDVHNRPALYERFPEDVEQTAEHAPIGVAEARTIYPNLRAADAFFFAELFSRIDPEQSDAYWNRATKYADYGMYHGLYGLSDIEATHALVAEYFARLEQSEEGQAFLAEVSDLFE